MQYIYNIPAYTSMTCIYSDLHTQHDVKNSAYRIPIPNTNSEIMHFQSLKLFLKLTLLIIVRLNHCSEYKCAQTYIQIPWTYNYTLSDVSTSSSLHDSQTPTIVHLYNHNCMDQLCLTDHLCFAWTCCPLWSWLISCVGNDVWHHWLEIICECEVVWSMVMSVAVINGGRYEDCCPSGWDAI
jgi:hypothetical protein